MMFLPKVMDRVIYYDELKNTEIRLKLLNKYFAKHPYLSNFKMALELKREHEKKGPKNAKNKNDKKSKFLAQKFFKKLLKSALGLIVENMNFVIRFSLIYATCYVCSDIKDQSLYMYSFKPYDLSLLLWSLITFIMPLTFETELFLIRFALNVSFPTFLLGMFSRLFVIFYRKEKGLPTNYEKMESMKTTRMLTFFILLSYTCLHIIKANKRAQDTKIARWYQEKQQGTKTSIRMIIDSLVNEFVKLLIRFSRNIALIFAIGLSLQSINLWNTLLLFFTLMFFWTSKKDAALWPVFLNYNIMALLLLFISQLMPQNIPKFNQEITSMLGVSKVRSFVYRQQFWLSFFTCFFSSLFNQYKDILVDKVEATHSKKQMIIQAILDKFLFHFKKIHVDYMVWIYHLGLIYLLSSDKSDFFSLLLFCVDIVIFLLHLRIHWTKPENDRQTAVLKSWYPSFFLVLLVISLRYLSFFIRYRFLRSMLEGIVGKSLQDSTVFKMLFRNLNAVEINNLAGDFLVEIIILGISFLTLTGLNKNRVEYLGLKNKLSEKEQERTVRLNLKAKQMWRKLALSVRKKEKCLFTNFKYGGGLEKEKAKLEKNLNQIEEVPEDDESRSNSMDSDLMEGIASPDKQDLREYLDNDLNAELKPKGIILEVKVSSEDDFEKEVSEKKSDSHEKSRDSIDDILDDHFGTGNNLFLSSTAKKFDKVATKKVKDSQVSNITLKQETVILVTDQKPTFVRSEENSFDQKDVNASLEVEDPLKSQQISKAKELSHDSEDFLTESFLEEKPRDLIDTKNSGSGDDPDKIFRRWNIVKFIIFFIIGKASGFILTVVFLGVLSDPNTFDCYFIGAELLYFNILFINFSNIFKLFRLPAYLKYMTEYFKFGFVKIMKEHNSFPDLSKNDLDSFKISFLEHSRLYLVQLCKKMEIELLETSVNMCILRLIVMIYRILSEYVSNAGLNITEKLKLDIRMRIVIVGLIVFEILLLKVYISGSDTIKEQDDQTFGAFMTMLFKKLDFLLFYAKAKNREVNYLNKKKSETSLSKINQDITTDATNNKAQLRVVKIDQHRVWKSDRDDSVNMITHKRQEYLHAASIYERLVDPLEETHLSRKDFYLGAIEELEIDLIHQSKNKVSKGQKPPKIRLIMCEGVSNMCKFLFVHRNKHKMAFCDFISGLHQAMRRFLMIPLLFASFTIQNPINIFTLVPCIYYCFKSVKDIEEDIKFFLPVFSIVFGVTFSFEQIKKSSFLKIFFKRFNNSGMANTTLSIYSAFLLIIAMSFGIRIYYSYFVCNRLFVIRKRFKTLFFYFGSNKAKVDNGTQSKTNVVQKSGQTRDRKLSILENLQISTRFQNLDDSEDSIEVEELKTEQEIKEPKSQTNNIHINFKKWNASGLTIFSNVINSLYINCSNYYLITIFCFCILHKSYLNLMFLAFVIVLTLFSSFKKFNRFSLKNLKAQKVRLLTKVVVVLIFFLNFKFNLIIIVSLFTKYFGSWGDRIKDWVEVKDGMFAFGFVGLMTLILQDFMLSQQYLDEVKNTSKKQKLRSKFVGLCESYKINEQKIYERVLLITKMSRLSEIEEVFWEQNDDNLTKRPEELTTSKPQDLKVRQTTLVESECASQVSGESSPKKKKSLQETMSVLNFDYKYWHRELGRGIESSMKKLRDTYLQPAINRWLSIKQFIAKKLITNTETYLFEDTLCVLLKVLDKNKFIFKKQQFDIEYFYEGRYKHYEYYFDSISKFYDMLRRRMAKQTELYMDNFLTTTNQHEQKIEVSEEGDLGIDVSSMSIISSESIQEDEGALYQKKNFNLFMSTAHFMQNEKKQPKAAQEFFDKTERQLERATNILFSSITASVNKDQINLSNQLENTEVFRCKYRHHNVTFFNIERNYLKQTQGFFELKFRLFLEIVVKWVISNFEVVISLLLVMNQLISGAIDNVYILGILIFRILPEVHMGSNKWWNILFIAFLFKCTLKYTSYLFINNLKDSGVQYIDQSKIDFSLANPVNWINLMFGNFRYGKDVFMLVSIFLLNMILEKKGFSETLQFEYEDPGSCTTRLCLNNDKHIIFDTNSKMVMYENSLQNDWIVSYLKNYEQRTGKPILRNYNLDLIKQRIHVRLIYDVFRKEFNRHLITYIKRTRNDHHQAMPDNIRDFFWRNFSIYSRKIGFNVYWIGTLSLAIGIILSFIILPTLGREPNSLNIMIKADKIIGQITITVVVLTVVLIYDSVINRKFDMDITGINRPSFLFKQFKRMNIKLKSQNLFTHPIIKMRKAFRKLAAVMRWKKITNYGLESIKDNPLKLKYKLAIYFWIVLHILIYFMIIAFSNEDGQLGFLEGLVCYFNFATNRCRKDNEWTLIRILYFFPMIYVLVCAVQIHHGSRQLSSRVTKFDTMEKVGHMIKTNIPFGRELQIAMDYLSNKSSLQFKHRLIYDDISNTLKDAKFNEIGRLKTTFGRSNMKIQRIVVAICWFFLGVIVLFGPLIPFVFSNKKATPFELESGNIRVYVSDRKGNRLGDMFRSDINYIVRNRTLATDLNEKLGKQEMLFFRNEQFRQLNLSTRSEGFQNLQDSFFVYRHNQDFESVLKELIGGTITFELGVAVKSQKPMSYTFTSRMPLLESDIESVKELANMIISDCTKQKISRTIYMQRIPLVLQMPLNSSRELYRPSLKNESLVTSTKMSITSDCSKSDNTVFKLETDDYNSGSINFIVITVYDKKQIPSIVRDILGADVKIVILYILLLNYVGKNFLRKTFFDRQSMIWYTDIPEPEKLICLLDAIRYAQYEGDYLREELLFYKLVDILRNPESVRQMTGNIREKQWEAFMIEKKAGQLFKQK